MQVFVDFPFILQMKCICGCWFALLWMDTSLSIVILSLLIFSMMIVNIFFPSLSPFCHCSILHWFAWCHDMRTGGSFTLVLEFFHGTNRNSTHLNHHWNEVSKVKEGQRKREREKRQWKHLLICVRSCMEKRQMCVRCVIGMAKMRLVWTSSISKLRVNRTFACVRVFRLISQRSAIQNVLRYRGKCCSRCAVSLRFILFLFFSSSLSCSFLFVSCV